MKKYWTAVAAIAAAVLFSTQPSHAAEVTTACPATKPGAEWIFLIDIETIKNGVAERIYETSETAHGDRVYTFVDDYSRGTFQDLLFGRSVECLYQDRSTIVYPIP